MEVMHDRKQIESMYYLSPLQEGLLFHRVAEGATDPYFCHYGFLLEGALEYDAFVKAWQRAVDRHPILRTGFAWEGVEKPLQIVRRTATLPIHRHDWRGLPVSERRGAVDALLHRDRLEGFDFLQPPLMRLHLIAVADNTWYLFNSHHHILLDGWSVALLLKEVVTEYESLRQGHQLTITPPPPYRDYIAWLSKQDQQAAEQFWRTSLTGIRTPTTLPLDSDQEPQLDGQLLYAEQEIVLSGRQRDAVRIFAQRYRLTINTVVQGAWATLLSRYSGEREVLFGSTVSGRPAELADSDIMIGLFINTMPVRVSLPAEMNVRSWLQALQEQNSAIRQYEWTPLSNIQRWSEIPAGRPMFDTIVVFESFPEDESIGQQQGVRINPLSLREKGAYTLTAGRNNYPLSLMVEPGAELRLILCYARRRFSHGDISHMFRHYVTLLDHIVSDDDRRLADLSILEGEERRLVLSQGVASPPPESSSSCIHDLFERWVRMHPEQIAVMYEGQALTGGELDAKANRLASYLRTVGVRPEVLVGLCMERSLDLIVGLLAVLKAGGGYVPLDPKLPADRVNVTLKDSGVRVVLTQSQWSDVVADSDIKCVCLDRDWPAISTFPDVPPVSGVRFNHTAYVIYTSGSTGRPKGVAVEHRQVVNYVHGLLERLALPEEASFATVSTVGADLGNTSIFGALCSGRPLHVLSTERGFDPDAMAEYMHQHQVDVLKITPSHLTGLLEAAQAAWVLPQRCLILGGERSRPRLIERIRALAPDCQIINHYGPTETTVGVLVHQLIEADDGRTDIPVGRPLANIQAYILDRDLQPTPVGLPGELYIGGSGLARGYLHRPEATAERFIPDLFSASPGRRLYRTGDRARLQSDGTIAFLGRVDNQVKVRGFRIELEEIDVHLRAEPAVEDAVTIVRETADGTQQLLSYVVGSATPDVTAIRTNLARRLPDYMVPHTIVVLDAFPLTANGKVDRSALPDPQQRHASVGKAHYVAPRNRTEDTLVQIWTAVLRVEQVGVHDNFFDLGGDSILCLQIVAKAHRVGIKLTPKLIFQHHTVAAITAILEEPIAAQSPQDSTHKGVPSEPFSLAGLDSGRLQSVISKYEEGVEDLYPTSSMQQGMLFHSLYDEQDGAYHNHVVYAFKQGLDPEAFEKAWQQAVDRHPVLRTGFLWDLTPEPLQVVLRHVRIPVERLDWRTLTDDIARQTALDDYLVADRARGFTFDQPPLMRLALIRRAEHSWWVVWSLHHAVLDGSCQSLLVQEVMTVYERIRRGESSVPKPVPSYRDYIRWFLQRDFAAAETFWRKYLEGFHGPTRLPERTYHGLTAGVRYGEQRVDFPPVIMRALQRLAQSHRVTVNTVIQAVWALLLSCYSGEDDVLFGVTVSGRPEELSDGDTMLGLFINTVPLRVRMAPNASLGEWLQEIQSLNVDLRRYEYSPLVQIQGWSEIRRGTAMFDSVLVFQNYLVDDAIQEFGRTLGVEAVEVQGWTNYPLTITVVPEGHITVIFSYDKHRLDDMTVSQVARHWELMIDNMIAMPDVRTADLSVLSSEERQHLLVDWNASQRPYPSDRCLHELFEAQVDRTPDRIAVSFEEVELTYRELNARANQLAHVLVQQGVGPDVLVGICLERSHDLLVAMLAVLKASGGYVPLDPTYPRERLAYMLHDAQIPVVITHRSLLQDVAADTLRLIDMDDWPRIARESVDKISVRQTSDHLAYVIYTSGSTGRPKGVMIRHCSVVNFLLSMEEKLHLSGDDVMVATTSVSFDIAVLELFLPLLVGGKTVVISREVALDEQRLSQALVEVGATLMQATPSGWRMMLGAAKTRRLQVLCGGEMFPRDLAHEFFAHDLDPWNLYGPTETTVWSMMTPVTCVNDAVPLGRPIANTQIYLLDSHLNLVPIGVPGEVYIGGDGLARGYWQRPELTAEKFIPNPFGIEPGSRLYRTGDQARYRSDGTLEFLGRVDYQVKLRGYRIELGEIESCLNKHPRITQGIVLARKDDQDTRLVAYVIQVRGEPVAEQELKRFLQAQLPEYMVPSTFVFLDVFPLTPNGKVDRKALPVPRVGRVIDQYVAPHRVVEEILAGIWTEALGVTPIGPHDNFFDLGGHSLLATQVMSRVRAAFQIELPLRSLFDFPTIEEFAAVIDQVTAQDAGAQAPPIVLVARTERLPLSFAQQRLWFLWQMDSGSPIYNIPISLRFTGTLDVLALQKCFHELVGRHEALRTTFVTTDDQPKQVIAFESAFSIPILDLKELPHDEGESRVQLLAHEEALRPFDLATGPLLRTRLVRLTDHDHVLFVTMHHIVSDAWSISVLIREMTALYTAFLSGLPSPLLPLSIQYADYATWQRQWLQGDVLDKQFAYWKKEISEIPILALPTDRPRPPVQTHQGAIHDVKLSSALTGQLKSLSRRHGVTLFMTLLAGIKVLLKYKTRQNDIVVGTDVANRNRVETEGVVGFFVNQLVLRTGLDDDMSFVTLLGQVREVALAAYAHQDVPFEMLVAAAKVKRDIRYSPLFQVKLVLQNVVQSQFELPGLVVSQIDVGKTTAELDLLINFEETPEGLSGSFEYNTDLFNLSSIIRFAEQFISICEQVVAQSAITLTEIENILAETDEQQRRKEQLDRSETNSKKLKTVKRKVVSPSA